MLTMHVFLIFSFDYAYGLMIFFSSVAEQLSAQHGAVKMLHSKVRVILDYIKAVQSGTVKQMCVQATTMLSLPPPCSGELPKNHEILREISSLCDQLPVLDKSFQTDFHSVSSQPPTSPFLISSILAPINQSTANQWCNADVIPSSNNQRHSNSQWGMYVINVKCYNIICYKTNKHTILPNW